MKTRVLAGLLIAGTLLAAALSGKPYIHYPLMFVFVMVAGNECFNLLGRAGLRPHKGIGLLFGGLWLLSIPIFPYDVERVTLVFAGVLVLTLVRQIFLGAEQAVQRIAGTLFGFFYVFVLFGFAFLLFNGGFPGGGTRVVEALSGKMIVHNWHLVLYTLVVTKACDAGAYFVGSSIGKNKMAPKISPGKTWEGTLGGIAIAVGAAFLFAYVFLPKPCTFHVYKFTPLQIAISGLAIAVMGVFGDLAESLLKRSADQKDSGNLAPGIGGALDMIDSPLFTFPTMFFLLELWHH